MTNFFTGLARGPIDHNASAVINSIANGDITMGSAVQLVDIDTIAPAEILPRVEEVPGDDTTDSIYGIVVGGDIDGIYGDGSAATNDTNLAASAGQGVVVVTQGRCLARVDTSDGPVAVGQSLGSSNDNAGTLAPAIATSVVIARALQPLVTSTGLHIIAVDIQREGIF